MPQLKPICTACEDTLKNSKGGDCYICEAHGRIVYKYCNRCGCMYLNNPCCPECKCPEYSLERNITVQGWERRGGVDKRPRRIQKELFNESL